MQTDVSSMFFSVVVLIISIVIHEVAHGYAAYALGDPTAKLSGRLTMNPLKHLDPVGSVLVPVFLIVTGAGVLFGWAKPVPYNPFNLRNQRWGEALVAAAGSLTNLFLAVVFALIARYAYGLSAFAFGDLSAAIAFINLFLGLFNLIPIPPMDGYTVLRGILPYRFSLLFRSLEERIRAGGVVGLILVLVVFVLFFSGPFYTFVLWLFNLLIG